MTGFARLAAFAVAAACMFGVIAPQPARANDYSGYVCSLTQRPADSTYPGGTLTIQLNTLPNCGGSVVRSISMCSAAEGSPGLCMVPTVFERNYQGLMQAMQSGLRVTISDTAPFGSYAYIIQYSAH